MQFKYFTSLLFVGTLLYQPGELHGSRILAAFIFPGKSHFMMSNELVRELLRNGHEVTYLTPFSLAQEQLGSNYTELLIPVYDFWKDIQQLFNVESLFELTKLTNSDFLTMLECLGVKSTEHALKQPNIQALINAKHTEDRFDLLIAEQFYGEAFLALAYKFNIPIITSCTFGFANYMSQMLGIISPWSFVPHAFSPFSDRMSFVERLQNTFISFHEDMYRKFVYQPQQDALVQRYFGHLPIKLPSVAEMERNISVILINTYMPLITAQPTSANVIPVGGLHIVPPKKLPNDMQNFLDDAKDGAIYFSLGTNVRSSDMSAEQRQIFLDVFSSLKQRVLWKFEDENVLKLPANVMIKKWMPQNDILAHPNVKVFITHGGLFGTQEGVHYGKPMLGMPVYCDQHLNMVKAVKGGYAISLHFQSITKAALRRSLQELLENPEYSRNIARVSQTFRDRPQSAKESAMYWIEYVIRQQGAPHMRLAGVDLAWYQFYLLDVLFVLLSGILIALILMVWAIRKLIGALSAKEKLKRS